MSRWYKERKNTKKTIKEGGIPNTQLLELMYADDTMLISKKAESIERILHLIEQFAPYFGLTLNRTKCAHLRINSESNITFVDDSPTKIENELTYLGAKINDQLNIHKEITAKLQQTMGTWKKLSPYWKNQRSRTGQSCWSTTLLYAQNWCMRSKQLH